MNEMDILKLFYEEMREKGVTRNEVFLTLEEDAAAKLSQKFKKEIPVDEVQHYADICIANEWLERTTADVH